MTLYEKSSPKAPYLKNCTLRVILSYYFELLLLYIIAVIRQKKRKTVKILRNNPLYI